MQLNIPGDHFNHLSVRTAPGSTEIDALREILDAIEWLETDQLGPPELSASLAQLDQSLVDITAGRVLTVAEARQVSFSNLS